MCDTFAEGLSSSPSTHIRQATAPVTPGPSHPWTLTSSGTASVFTDSRSAAREINIKLERESVSDIGLLGLMIMKN